MIKKTRFIIIPTQIKHDPLVVSNQKLASSFVQDIKDLGKKIREHNLSVKLLDRTMNGPLYDSEEGRKYRSKVFKFHSGLKKTLLSQLKDKTVRLKEVRALGTDIRQTLYETHNFTFTAKELSSFIEENNLDHVVPDEAEKRHLQDKLTELLSLHPDAVVWVARRCTDEQILAFIAGINHDNNMFDMRAVFTSTPDWETHCEAVQYLVKLFKRKDLTPITIVNYSDGFVKDVVNLQQMGGEMLYAQFIF